MLRAAQAKPERGDKKERSLRNALFHMISAY